MPTCEYAQQMFDDPRFHKFFMAPAMKGAIAGIAASVDILAVSSFRDQGLYAKRDKDGDGGDEFMRRAERDGLKAAMKWREETFGNKYRPSDADDD
jgi:hypothetical protein